MEHLEDYYRSFRSLAGGDELTKEVGEKTLNFTVKNNGFTYEVKLEHYEYTDNSGWGDHVNELRCKWFIPELDVSGSDEVNLFYLDNHDDDIYLHVAAESMCEDIEEEVNDYLEDVARREKTAQKAAHLQMLPAELRSDDYHELLRLFATYYAAHH
nr:hypothetical protein K-LCC10_0217 [Kaumoebavirus]